MLIRIEPLFADVGKKKHLTLNLRSLQEREARGEAAIAEIAARYGRHGFIHVPSHGGLRSITT